MRHVMAERGEDGVGGPWAKPSRMRRPFLPNTSLRTPPTRTPLRSRILCTRLRTRLRWLMRVRR